MLELIAQGKEPGQHKRFPIPSSMVTLGKTLGLSHWVVEWDPFIHGAHVTIHWKGDELHVAKIPGKPNPLFFQGARTDAVRVKPGDCFVLGTTAFTVTERDTAEPGSSSEQPMNELTCRFEELDDIKFTDTDVRIDALAKLPELIRRSPTNQELETRVVEALARGIPGASAAALVQLDRRSTAEEPILSIKAATPSPEAIRASRKLVYKSVRTFRQGFVTDWTENRSINPETAAASNDWALCTPIKDDRLEAWALYATGSNPPDGLAAEQRKNVQKSNLKFANLVADIFVSLRRVVYLQRREALLRRFLSPRVVAKLGDKTIEHDLARRDATVTVLFCDLRGFSRLTEGHSGNLAGVCDRVSEALAVMTSNILDKDGVISDFQGDSAMGFWGWPEDDPDQVEKAARAARAIRKEFAQSNRKPGHPLADFNCGIGIAHGKAIAGMLGTVDQFKVGVFGPVVNLAARLEGLTKAFKVSILLDKASATALAKRDKFDTRAIGRVMPAGMQNAVELHELICDSINAADRDDFNAALQHFESGNWRHCLTLLERLPDDGPSEYLRTFITRNGGTPPVNWNGTIVMNTKSFE